MDKETLSNYGWIVICVMVLAVMLAFASPFGNFVANAIKSTTQGLFDTNQNALDSAGIEIMQQEFETMLNGAVAACGIENHYDGDGKGEHGIATTECTAGHTYTCECSHLIVPSGGVFASAVSESDYVEYNGGEKLPCGYLIKYGDMYTHGDYIYGCADLSGLGYEDTYGWTMLGVVDKTKEYYPDIEDYVLGLPVVGMMETFKECANLKASPQLPSTLLMSIQTFQSCTSLTDEGIPVIPNGVLQLWNTFAGCTKITKAPAIPDSVLSMEGTFWGCTALTTAPTLPSNIVNMIETFRECRALKTYVGSTDADGDFSNYVIPNSVVNMSTTFRNCSSIITAPVIPEKVVQFSNTFYGCTSLTGAITINATPTYYTSSLYNTKITEILGNCEIKTELLATK